LLRKNKKSPAASPAEAPSLFFIDSLLLLHLSLLLSLFIDFVDILSFHSSVIDAEIERDLR
jgi:hypothetical protein